MERGRHRIPRALATLALLAVVASVLSCGSGEKTLGVADPLAAPLTPTYEQAKAILDKKCVGCHGGDGEPEDDDPNYETCAGILAGLDGILTTSVFGGSMPPGALPRLTEREKLILDRWIVQGAHSPCNP